MMTFVTIGVVVAVIGFVCLEIAMLITEAADEIKTLFHGSIDKFLDSRNRYWLRWHGVSGAND